MPKKKISPKSQEPKIQEELFQACRELNPKADEGLLRSCAEFLHISSFSGGLNDRPNVQQKGGTRAKEQLFKLARDLAKVRKNLDQMNVEARTALQHVQAGEVEAERQGNIGKPIPAWRRKAPDVDLMEYFIKEYIRLAYNAFDTLEKSSAPKGAPKKHRPKEITKIVLHVFQVLTKKKPTLIKKTDTHRVYGPVYNFGTKIFEIMNIDASFESQADAFLYPSDSPL